MKNTIKASQHFFFKGQALTPEVLLDLDDLMAKHGCIPELHIMLAKQHGISLYSYEFEMMQMEPILYSDAAGLAKAFFQDQAFDHKAFEQAWKEQKTIGRLGEIAKQHMAIESIDQVEGLTETLLAVYQAGLREGS